MSRRIRFQCIGETGSNDAAVASKASTGANTNSFTQSTATRKPKVKSSSNADSSIKSFFTSLLCDGSSVLGLASSESLAGVTPHTIIFAWTSGDYTNDTWLVSSTTGNGHYGIDAGGGGVLFKNASAKSTEASIATSTTNGGTTAYTFGSGVEMIAFVNDGANKIDVYNIDGDLIGTNTSAGNSSAFPIDYILGKSDGTRGLNGEIIDFQVFGNTAMSASLIKGYGNQYKQIKST